MKQVIFLALINLAFISCRQKEAITKDMLIGKYVCVSHSNEPQWRDVKNILELNVDSTYSHQIYRGNQLVIEEKGQWEYTNYALPNLKLYNFTVLLEYVSDSAVIYDKYAGLVVKRTFHNNLIFEANIPHDPDGAPMRPIFKKLNK